MDVRKIDDWLNSAQFEVVTRGVNQIMRVKRLNDGREFGILKSLEYSSTLYGKKKTSNFLYIRSFSEDCIHVTLRQVKAENYKTIESHEETVEINTL